MNVVIDHGWFAKILEKQNLLICMRDAIDQIDKCYEDFDLS